MILRLGKAAEDFDVKDQARPDGVVTNVHSSLMPGLS